ncbi:hypothetical protein JHK87_048260 [Glycine soja]|nr:hypothetical protein JHK87_048260 [Glycine soja]
MGKVKDRCMQPLQVGYPPIMHCNVEAIQACGGQKTVDGRRFRTGGGVLWSIIKVREPNAYKEIMNKAKEFEECD